MIVYLAGPMTGYPEFNFPAFRAATARLRAAGWDIRSPHEWDEAENGGRAPTKEEAKPWSYYLRRDLRLLLECEAVAVLPGWRESKGASLEVHTASALGMAILDAETMEPLSETVLEEANRIVNGARGADYGTPLDNHTRTAGLFAAYLGIPLTAEQVCFLNILQKISRGMNRVTRDTLVDIAGYAANVEMVQAERERRTG